MNIPDLKTALNEGIVLFQFIKKDGTIRHARGTTCPDLVPADDTPKGVRTPEQQALYDRQTVAFYDIDGDPCASTPSGLTPVPSNSPNSMELPLRVLSR